jgi:hypothetical protein
MNPEGNNTQFNAERDKSAFGNTNPLNNHNSKEPIVSNLSSTPSYVSSLLFGTYSPSPYVPSTYNYPSGNNNNNNISNYPPFNNSSTS